LAKGEDEVFVSNNARWTIDYYLDTGREAAARQLAKRTAGTGALSGLLNQAFLLERLGDLAGAEAIQRAGKERYQYDVPLLQFYFRRSQAGDAAGFAAPGTEATRRLFPEGLRRLDMAGARALQPSPLTRRIPGFVVSQDPTAAEPVDERFVLLGLEAGNIIVAANGIRIENHDQWVAVLSLSDAPIVSLLVWRAGEVVEVNGVFRRSRHGSPRKLRSA
jgi:hypothetical protein